MPLLPPTVANRALPPLQPVRQSFPRPRLADVYAGAYAEAAARLRELGARPGARVAIGAGSRGIRDLVPVVKATVAACRDAELAPFVVPAMGSHGGGTADGQRHVLEHLGVTEAGVGAPIVSDTRVVQIGATSWGMPVYFDQAALEADFVVPVNRVKPHTDFAGTHESGLCKMLVIGFANHAGCSRVHQETFARFHLVVPEIAALILEKIPVPFGMAIVENAYDETYLVEAVARERILTREAELLQIAYAHMPRLYFDHIDVLIVDEIGKNISGAGMDPNIVGRTAKGILAGYTGPSIARIVVAGLTEVGGGNAIGIGQADFTTQHVADHFDAETTYANAIAAGTPESGRLPIVLPTLDDAVRAALLTASVDDWSQAVIVRIKNTLHIDTIWVSDALADTVEGHPDLQWVDGAAPPVETR
ncbi:MAG: lactate racemase domain-containing protein [Caldilinea sp.]